MTRTTERAAEWLDEHWPDSEQPWWELIDTSTLRMNNGCFCVAGQLGAHLAQLEGYERFCPSNLIDLGVQHRVRNGWEALTCDLDAVRANLDVRRERQAGCPTLGGERAIETLEEEIRLTEVLWKRLEVTEGDLPWYMRRAFSSCVPNDWWIREIELRRERGG